MDHKRKEFQQWLMDHLEDQNLIAIVQRVLQYLEKEKEKKLVGI